jgi:hypothetical protein
MKLTTSQAADYLHTSFNRVKYAVKAGHMKPEETPFGWLFTKPQLLKYARDRARAGRPLRNFPRRVAS